MGASAALAMLLGLALVSPIFGITPALSPTSDKKFFGSRGDYPTDTRNNKVLPSHNNFKYPFPVVQDSRTYDEDYVKDENSDNNYWKFQTEYDRLRKEVAFKLKVLEDVKATAAGHQDARDAKESHQDAKAAAEAAAAGHQDAKESHQSSLEQAEADLQKCLSELEAAKRELARRKAVAAEAKKAEDQKEEQEAAAEEQVAAAKALEEKAEEKLGEESEESAKSQRTLAEEQKEFDKVHADLDKAEAELRKFMPARTRKDKESLAPPCPKGCKSTGGKSAALRTEASVIVCIIAAVLSVRLQ